ncbi:MAG TPA: SPOR domain-containing protein [Gammaproteobacteria bacterium]|nr:SPOR domain-containing protein [Gammaproteobacteria bacterium]
MDRAPVEAPPAWSLLITGIIVGIAAGVFGCVLFYLSGNVPPLNLRPVQSILSASPEDTAILAAEENADELQLDFYNELRDYEVTVDVTPVELEDPAALLSSEYMLQAGAFKENERANKLKTQMENLGLTAIVKQGSNNGNTLYLVQSGPYSTNGELAQAEQLHRTYNLGSLRLVLQ